MEKSCTLNVRLTLKGDKETIYSLYQQFLDVIKDNDYILFSSIDYNNPKDSS